MFLDATWLWMSNMKWIILFVGTSAGFLVLVPAQKILASVKTRYMHYQKWPQAVRYFLAKEIQFPLSWLIATGVWSLTFKMLGDLHEYVIHVLGLVLHLLVLINLMRLAYLAVESFGQLIEDFAERTGSSMDGQLGPFATRVLKIVVIIFGFLLSLQSLGLNVGALLAGLGIGSLAFALAAQDTVANLFGSITLIFDRPFQRGDYVKLGEIEGTVEEVGFRSTQLRTPNKSLITIPNSIMAKEKIENLSARPYRRFNHTIFVSLDNSPALLQNFAEAVKGLLQQDHLVIKTDISVGITLANGKDCKILIDCYLQITTWAEELKAQEQLLLQLLSLAQEMQLKFPENMMVLKEIKA
jgi:MscS family membrane protein